MVYFNEPIPLTKVAEYYGDLENDVISFNFEAERLEMLEVLSLEYIKKNLNNIC